MKAVVAAFEYAITFLQFLVDRPSSHTTLVICSTREGFLSQITPTVLATEPQEIPPSQESVAEEESTSKSLPHRFLVPTLQLLARSRAIKLVYCPSIDTLRAYLSSYAAPPAAGESPGRDSSPKALLAIVDLVLLHHATSEFSVQGLMRTFASAVEAASRNFVDLMLCECRDVHDPTNPNCGPGIWDADAPLLSGSVRLGIGGSVFAGRTVSVRRIAGRWFSFEQQQPGKQELDDEEMLV